ncbi:MAG: hypothetical protein JW768_10715 [Chitinispirillaceae bacterium]|nr:hypothetical protein [Chitinispirillaceae bacterium]
MTTFVQYLPYDALATRTITLEPDKIVMHYKSLNRNYSEEYAYSDINPDFRTVRRGEKEWSGVIYGLIMSSVVLFIFVKIAHSFLFKSLFLFTEFAFLITAAYLFSRIVLKKEFVYIFDRNGECILALKATHRAKEFVNNLRGKVR